MRKVITLSIVIFLLLCPVVIGFFGEFVEERLNTTKNESNWYENWSRDKNHNKIDDLIDDKIENNLTEERISIHISYGHKPTNEDIEKLYKFDFEITYIAKFISTISVSYARIGDLNYVVNLTGVIMISVQSVFKPMLDIASLTVKARGSSEYSPESAWELGYTGRGINIAIVDSGVDDEHESLDGKFIAGIEIRDPVEIESNPDDTNGHGTAMAGAAMGTGGQDGDYKGTAPNAKLIDIKVGGKPSVHNGGNIIKAIDWCIEHKDEYNIRIISISSGDTGDDDGNHPESQAVNKAVENGIIVVVAIGNDGPDNDGIAPPASADKAIVIGAFDDQGTVTRDDDIVADFSCRGPRGDDGDSDFYDELKPDVMAPGVNIKSAKAETTTGAKASNDYIEYSGTSISTPIVSGIIALMLEANSNLTPFDVKKILHQTSKAKGEPSYPDLDPKYNTEYGYGIVDAYEAVKIAMEYEPTGNDTVDGLEPVELEPPTSITNNSMFLSWSESINDDFFSYEIHMSNSQDFIPYSSTLFKKIVDRTKTSQKVTNLKSNTTYFFKVKVFNNQNQHIDSNEVYATTLQEKSPDINLKTKDESLVPVIIIIIICSFLVITIAIKLFRKQNK